MAHFLDDEKRDLLEREGFGYSFDRMIFVNSERRKVFSFEAVEDNNVEWLREKIEEANIDPDLQIYFNMTVTDEVKQDLLNLIYGGAGA